MPPGATATVPTARWERRYREALNAAAIAFAKSGYTGASTKDIADQLGVRQAGFYYYFESKDAALAAVCEDGVTDFVSQLENILASDMSAADKLRAAIENHLAPLRTQPQGDYIRVFLRHRHELPDAMRKEVDRLARTYELLIEQLFAEGVETGEFRADLDIRLAALAMLGISNSVIGSRQTPRRNKLDKIISEYTRLFVEGVLAR